MVLDVFRDIASRRLDEGGSSQLSHGWRIGCGCVRFRTLKQKHLAPLMLGTPTFETNRVCLCISQVKREHLDKPGLLDLFIRFSVCQWCYSDFLFELFGQVAGMGISGGKSISRSLLDSSRKSSCHDI